ncbi:unnamed protein product [Urochloa decumbens]|uniref:BTB domain-containing protein n=1 Tax=Urochloa decumbens TaxID=240449 RepID=A0ABC9BNW3_9POAL
MQPWIKRQRTSEVQVAAQTTTMGSASAVVEFKLPCAQIKNVSVGEAVHSDPISAGGHMWRINCFPSGKVVSGYLGIYLELLSKSGGIKVVFEAFLMDKVVFGWPQFVRQMDLAKDYTRDGQITFVCSIMVLRDSRIPVPPSDIGKNLGMLLDSMDGADVSFTVDDETFHAHRSVVAARSPVFKAELLGSMAEATMPSIALLDIAPATFRIVLRFMYTDVFPGDDELGDSPSDMLQNLLAAADRYALNRLKLICARKLWDNMSVDTVADALACAEMYNCPELKDKCIDFIVAENNFKKAVLTESFMQLGQNFPSIIAEVRSKVGT